MPHNKQLGTDGQHPEQTRFAQQSTTNMHADATQHTGTSGATSEQSPHTTIARLNKIIATLIERAERSTSELNSDFNLFQTTLMLEKRVSERTGALDEALARNEATNRALRQSTRELEATQATQRQLIQELRAAHAQQQENERELRKHRDHLSDLVAEQTADLVRAKEIAEYTNRLKSEFLANMSHEFRTPLHAITSYATLGMERCEKLPPEKLLAYFSNIGNAAGRLTELVDHLLDLANLESGAPHLILSRHDILELIARIREEQSPLLKARGLESHLEVLAEHTHANIDSQRIKQVIRALYSNAIKYSPPGGHISLRLDSLDAGSDDQRLQLIISDQGPGIPPGEEESIFEKFVQSSGTKTGAGGTGLGLAVAREIMRLHKGRLSACNAASGGAVFTMELPA